MNRICAENIPFDLWCNELEEWFIERNYNPTVIWKQIPKTKAFSRDTFLDSVKEVKNNDRFVLAVTHHPSVKKFHNGLNKAHICLTPNKEHPKVFGDNPLVIGWKKPNSLKNHLVSVTIKVESSSHNKSEAFCRSWC